MRRVVYAVAAGTLLTFISSGMPVGAQGVATGRAGFDLVTMRPTVASQNPAGPCFNNKSRFVNCGNGTVTDTATGLIWLVNANCFSTLNYALANEAAASLGSGQCGLTDGSSPGDWRLASSAEWGSILDPSCPFGTPLITGNQRNGGCFEEFPWATGVQDAFYWTSTSSSGRFGFSTLFADIADLFFSGGTGPELKEKAYFAWPVRR